MRKFHKLADRAAVVFAELGDDPGSSQAANLRAHAHFVECRIADMESALDVALVHAERSGDRRRVLFLLTALGRAALVGPTPAVAAVERCEGLKEQGGGDRVLEAVLAAILAYLVGMQGRFDDAREFAAAGHAILEESGLMVLHGGSRTYSGAVELLAGDPAAAEREFRAGLATLEAIGEKGNLSTVAAYLAEALAAAGKGRRGARVCGAEPTDGVGFRRHLARRVASGASVDRGSRRAISARPSGWRGRPSRGRPGPTTSTSTATRSRGSRTCYGSPVATTRQPPPRSKRSRSTRPRGTSSPRGGSPSPLSRRDDERGHRPDLGLRELGERDSFDDCLCDRIRRGFVEHDLVLRAGSGRVAPRPARRGPPAGDSRPRGRPRSR